MGFFKKLKQSFSEKKNAVTEKFKDGLVKTRESFNEKLNDLFARYRKVDEDFFEELEEILIMADVGVHTVLDLIDELKQEVKRKNIQEPEAVREIIVEKFVEIYEADAETLYTLNLQPDGLTVILFVGVNGVGKTTTIGKLAYYLKNQGKHVMLAAGDTFRAGAIEQLQVWGERVGVPVIVQKEGADPASVMFDAIQAAKEKQMDVLLCDTAGRLQNKVNLMNELEKINRVIAREIPNAPHEVLLVIDATTGQNGLVQAKSFKEVTNVTGIVLTKLDGTAKGGVVIGIVEENKIPVKFIGVGEQIDDMEIFNAEDFVKAII